MNKWQVLVALGALCLWAPSGWADYVQGGEQGGAGEVQTYVCRTNESNAGLCNNAITGPVFVRGFKIIAEDAGAWCALYDAATVGATQATEPVDEIIEPTDEDMSVQLWTHPIKFTTAVSIAVSGNVSTNSECIVYYQ